MNYSIFMISFSIIFWFGILLTLFLGILKPAKKTLKPKNKKPNIGILIPARDESKVISALLESIKAQSYPVNMKDVFVIVESNKDKTVKIAKKAGCSVFVRKNLHLKRKGYALDEAIKDLKLYQKNYDLYMVFDADNVLEKTYIEKMIPTYQKGYDIAVGVRKNKNSLSSNLSDASILTFRMIDVINKMRIKKNMPVLISGSCFYMTKELIKKWRGFPFCSLTEDYELSIYSSLNDISATQVFDAFVYDEQPDCFKDSKNQRLRWIRGYLDNQRAYRMKMFKKIKQNKLFFEAHLSDFLGILPYLFALCGLLGMIFTSFSYFIVSLFHTICFKYLMYFLVLLIGSYVILLTLGVYLLKKDNVNFFWYHKLRIIGFFPLFLFSYVPCFIASLFHKNLEWKKIDHRISSYKS